MRVRTIIIGICFFFLFYFEPLTIGPIKFAHLWKIVLLIFLLFNGKLKIRKDPITIYSFLYYAKYLATTGVFYFGYFGDALLMFVRGLTIPIINNYLLIKNYSEEQLFRFLKLLSSFVILSSIPFLLGLLEPISRGYELYKYGQDSNGFVGIFQNPHGAAIVTSQSLLIVLYVWLKRKRASLFSVSLFALGFITLYLTYVRTGYIIFFVGVCILLYKEFGLRRLHNAIPIFLLITFSGLYFYSTDIILQRRILQKNIYSSDSSVDLNRISSGRFLLSKVNLENYLDSDLPTQIIGMGYQYSKELMQEDIGLELMSHNGFVDAIVHNGIIGIILFLLFLKSLFKTILVHQKEDYSSLALATLWPYIVFIFVQGGNIFLYELELLTILALSRIANNKEGESDSYIY